MVDLDDKGAVVKVQGGDTVLRSVNALPDQLTQSFTESLQVDFSFPQIHNILVAGMGGSRFPALIIRELFKEEITVPYNVNDDYLLPGYLNSNSLIVLSSYSGTTEEVINAGKLAKEKGISLTGVTNGGEVKKMLTEMNAPAYYFDPVHNPSTQPRIGFGYLVGGHLGLLLKLGVLKISEGEIITALKNLPSLLQQFKIETPTKDNPAKQLALKLVQKYPYYTVAEFLTGVGNAVANQTNETAKTISSYRVIPELNHHLMEGLKFPDVHAQIAMFVFLYSELYSTQIKKRFKITKDVVEQNKIETYWYEMQGKNKVEQAFELMGFGSYLSMYLSALYEQDPAAIPYVDYFKQKLKEM